MQFNLLLNNVSNMKNGLNKKYIILFPQDVDGFGK